MRIALLDSAGTVLNIALYDALPDAGDLPDGVAEAVPLADDQACNPGWVQDGDGFADPAPPPAPDPEPPAPTKAELLARIEALLAQVNALPAD